jgi:hypothetical protein
VPFYNFRELQDTQSATFVRSHAVKCHASLALP